MDHLIELAQFLSKNKFKHLEVFAPKSRLLEFYEKLRDGSFKTEAEARDYFFPNTKNAKAYFYRLSQQMEERLINLLFLIDFNETASSTLQKEALICHRNYAAFSSLTVRFMRQPAIKIAKETLKLSLKIELTEINLAFSRQLALHYGSIDPNKKKYYYYSQLVKTLEELLKAEILAEKYYAEILLHYVLKSSADLVFAKKIAEYAQELRNYTKHLSSYRLNLFSHYVFIFEHQLTMNHEKTIEACNNALTFFEQQSQRESRGIIFNFTLHLSTSLFILRRFEEAINASKKALTLVPQGNINWFSTCESMFYIYLHSEHYENSLEIVLKVKSNPDLSKQPILLQERWRVYEALVYYLIRTSRLKQPDGVEFKFRTKKFINEFNGAIHDKAGKNIMLIILQIMFLLLDKDYSSIIDRVDALKAYTHRHLRRDETYRSNCFIKMIMQLEKGDFHPVAVQRKAEPYYKKLLAVPLDKAKQDYDLEIIPYETLWSFILESLPSSHRTKVQDR